MNDAERETPQRLEDALIGLTVDAWRFTRASGRVLEKLDLSDADRFASQVRYFQKRIQDAAEDAQLSLVSLEGQTFDAGMAAVALNLDDFSPDDHLVVDHMVEPIIMGPTGLKREGTMVLKKANP